MNEMVEGCSHLKEIFSYSETIRVVEILQAGWTSCLSRSIKQAARCSEMRRTYTDGTVSLTEGR